MTPSPLTVALDTQIVPAVTAMIGRGVSALPVVHDGKCEGILTVTDVAITLQCLLQIMRKAAARLGTSSNSGGNGGADSGQ
jgi:CBS domain-containing protein